MIIANMYEAKTQLSKLVEKALAGEDVVLAKAGKPLVKLVPTATDLPKRTFGLLKGKIKVSEDFNDFSEELEIMFKEYLPD